MQMWEKINRLIKEQGVTQEYLAKKANVNLRTLQAWSSKGTMPKADYIIHIAETLGVSVEWLVLNRETNRKYDIALARRPVLRSIVDQLLQVPEAALQPVGILARGLAESQPSANPRRTEAG